MSPCNLAFAGSFLAYFTTEPPALEPATALSGSLRLSTGGLGIFTGMITSLPVRCGLNMYAYPAIRLSSSLSQTSSVIPSIVTDGLDVSIHFAVLVLLPAVAAAASPCTCAVEAATAAVATDCAGLELLPAAVLKPH